MTASGTVLPRPDVERFLSELGSDRPHNAGNLYLHLQRVATLLAEWGANADLQLAGLCHACYGTDGSDNALIGVDRRPELAALIGEGAESLAYLYGACQRRTVYPQLAGTDPVSYLDRFTGETRVLSPAEANALMELSAANDLDVLAHNPAMAARYGAAQMQLFEKGRARLTAAAWQAWQELLRGTASTPPE